MQVEIEFQSGKIITDSVFPYKPYPLHIKGGVEGVSTQQIIIHHRTLVSLVLSSFSTSVSTHTLKSSQKPR
jgi:hypothetical protein